MSEAETTIRRLSANVKHARGAYGLSQRDLVALLNKELGDSPTNPASIARLEMGKREPRLRELVALSKVFHVEVEALTWEEDAFASMLEDRLYIGEFERSTIELIGAVRGREEARKALLEALERSGDGIPANMRGFLRRAASQRSDQVVEQWFQHGGDHADG